MLLTPWLEKYASQHWFCCDHGLSHRHVFYQMRAFRHYMSHCAELITDLP